MSKSIAEAFEFCPACGSKNPAVGSNPLNCPSCNFRFFFGPVTAVGAIVADPEGRVLFIVRANDPGKGKFGMPGGFVDAGESLEDALTREVFEETGLKVTQLTYLTSGPNGYLYKGVEIPVTDMFFVCTVESFDGMTAIDGEAAEFRLVRPTEYETGNMAFESNRLALEHYLEK